MHLIRLGGISLNQTPLDWDGNRHRIRSALSTARERELSIVCLPELCISGYGCEDMFQSPGVLRTSWEVLQEILPDTRGLIVSLGLPVRFESAIFDAVAVVVDGNILGLVPKQHLAGEGIHYEPRWFQPWPKGRRGQLSIDGHQVPIGDLRFDCGGVRIGFEICEDAWVSDRTGAQLAARGVDVILNPSASHFAFGKDDIRRRFVQEGSRAFGAAYVYTNLLGNEAGRAIYDGGVIIASEGKIIANGRRFSFADMSIAESVIDIDALRVTQSKLSLALSSENNSGECVVSQCAPKVLSTHHAMTIVDSRDAWEHGDSVKEEEFTRAVALGLFDSLRKSGSNGFVVSISGGADSAAVACLVALSIQLSIQELSRDEVVFRLGMTHLADD
ncbi:MAG: nitrilase-related carbon-nitrogen hydrolase, partial [Pirellulales bacterium]